MATFVANQAVNMSSTNGLGVLDTRVGLEQLMSASQTGEQQVWAVGAAGYLEIQLSVISNITDTGGTFSADFTKLELQNGPALGDTPKWTLTNIPLDVTGSFSFNNDFSVITVSVDVPGMGGVQASVQVQPLEVLSLSDTLSSGSYDTFAQYLLRQGDQITGSSGKDNLLGFGGNDTINGGGGDDILNGGTGGDRLMGGAGNDKLVWGVGDVKLDGGTGTDTMNLSVNLNLRNLANSKFVNLEQINMKGGGGDVLSLNVTDVLDFSSSTNTLKILGDTTDTVSRGSGWSGGSIVNGFRTYTQGAATLLVEDDIRVVA